MRQIKFRVWDKQRGKVRQSHNLLIDTYDGALLWQFGCNAVERLAQENYIVMEFTGLLDKHGKEIYEGDVVKFQTIRGVVEFMEGAFQVLRDVVDGYPGTGTFREGEPLTPDYEVLGNIYEQPELLKAP